MVCVCVQILEMGFTADNGCDPPHNYFTTVCRHWQPKKKPHANMGKTPRQMFFYWRKETKLQRYNDLSTCNVYNALYLNVVGINQLYIQLDQIAACIVCGYVYNFLAQLVVKGCKCIGR